jgi:hypothetical protein
VGDVVSIPLGDNRVAFGWVLKEPLLAFFDYSCDTSAIPAVSEIINKPIAFRIDVMNHAVTRGRWPVIGHATVPDKLLQTPWFFKKDIISGELSITQTGAEEIPATYEQCKALERCAVWDPEHVEDRLRDHFAGRPNVWVESLRLKSEE